MHGEAFCPSSHPWQRQPALISGDEPYEPRAPSAVPGRGFARNGGADRRAALVKSGAECGGTC